MRTLFHVLGDARHLRRIPDMQAYASQINARLGGYQPTSFTHAAESFLFDCQYSASVNNVALPVTTGTE